MFFHRAARHQRRLRPRRATRCVPRRLARPLRHREPGCARASATKRPRRMGRSTGGATGGATPAATTTTAKSSSRRNAPTDASELLHAAAAAFDATPRRSTRSTTSGRAAPRASRLVESETPKNEMTDLAKMVGEARGGRGRFKSRGGKSSRTPSLRARAWSARSQRESSPQRKLDWRGRRRRSKLAQTPAGLVRGGASSPFSVASPAASRRRTVSVEVSSAASEEEAWGGRRRPCSSTTSDRPGHTRGRWPRSFLSSSRGERRGGTLTIRRRASARGAGPDLLEEHRRHSYARRSSRTSPPRTSGEFAEFTLE